jgi:flagellar protein FliT
MIKMNSEEVISLYEKVAVITNQMVAAAREYDWEQLAELESLCASHVATLRQDEQVVPLTSVGRAQKVKIIQKILADDREIRSITEPWMEQLSALIKNAGAERKLSAAYGANQSG